MILFNEIIYKFKKRLRNMANGIILILENSLEYAIGEIKDNRLS